jgi:hypothetical protein
MVKTGDRVRFLNSVGGGIVKAFRDKRTVWVEDEHGFDVPVLVSECVVVGDSGQGQRESRTYSAVEPAVRQMSRPEPPKEEKVTETPEGERISVFLAFLPTDPKAMTQSSYEAYFINDSNYFLYYNYASRANNSWTTRSGGLIEPNTKIFMEEFGREDLNEFEQVCVQFVAFKKNKPYALKNTVSVELRIDTVKFYKVHCFQENDFFDEPALLFPVMREGVPEKPLLVSATELQDAMLQQKRKDRPASGPATSRPAQTPPPAVEIDLHIDRLLDNTAGMNAGDILRYQLEKFHQVMAQYAGRKGQKIVFIHGKGEGVLRAAIGKELKTRYKSCECRDASFLEYGFGATSVKIR